MLHIISYIYQSTLDPTKEEVRDIGFNRCRELGVLYGYTPKHDENLPTEAAKMTQRLDEVLEELNLSQYYESFIDQGFDTWETILDITESDLYVFSCGFIILSLVVLLSTDH